MSSSSDLSRGCKTRQTALAGAFKNFMVTGDQVEHIQNLERCLKALEEERASIEAFKRELPFCMQLLNDAIEVYKEHLTKYQSGSGTFESKFVESASSRHSIGVNPTFEEFMPLKSRYEKLAKRDGEEQLVKDSQRHIDRDKPAGWIAQAHPWRYQSKTGDLGQEEFMKEEQEGQEELDNLCIESNPALLPNSSLSSYLRQGSCGAFSPFVRPKQSVSLSEAEIHLAVPSWGHEDCQRASSFKKYEDLDDCVALERAEEHESVVVARQSGSYAASGAFLILENSSAQAAGQPQRKARRCWSPELHRRFVNALQQLGGPQDATPKQIRELMKVDGLTNDEVKSHLQKYRLHTRRSSLVLQPTGEQSPQLVVLGGLWLSPEYAASTIVQQSPGIHEQASEKHTSQCSFLSTRCLPYLSPSRQIQFQQTIFSEQLQQSPSNSNTTPQWQKQFSLPPQGSNEEQEKENNGDDVQSDNTSSRGDNLIRDKKNCRDSMGLECSGRDLNACDQHEEYDDGDVTEAEDSRGTERSLELPVCEKQTCFDGLKKSQIATP